jgi:glycerol 3-phosphatase-1
MPHHEDDNFAAPAETHQFAALLFDMDGTIIDSTPAIEKYWRQVGKEIGVDGDGTSFLVYTSGKCTDANK